MALVRVEQVVGSSQYLETVGNYEFTRVPCVGELITLGKHQSYTVLHVAHVAGISSTDGRPQALLTVGPFTSVAF